MGLSKQQLAYYKNINNWHKDDLIVSTGTPVIVAMTTAVASGGAVNATPTYLDVPDINSSTNKTRYGLISPAITTVASSRAQIQNPNLTRFQVTNTTLVGFGADLCFNGGQIDYTNDSCFQIVGFANAGTSGNPTQGVYIRPPYVGETNFYKCVLTYFDSGTSLPVNVIFETTVPYDSTDFRFLNACVLIDGKNDSVIYIIRYNGIVYERIVTNVLSTYPDMWSGSIVNSMTISCHRSGTPITGVARSIVVDKLYRFIQPNYDY